LISARSAIGLRAQRQWSSRAAPITSERSDIGPPRSANHAQRQSGAASTALTRSEPQRQDARAGSRAEAASMSAVRVAVFGGGREVGAGGLVPSAVRRGLDGRRMRRARTAADEFAGYEGSVVLGGCLGLAGGQGCEGRVFFYFRVTGLPFGGPAGIAAALISARADAATYSRIITPDAPGVPLVRKAGRPVRAGSIRVASRPRLSWAVRARGEGGGVQGPSGGVSRGKPPWWAIASSAGLSPRRTGFSDGALTMASMTVASWVSGVEGCALGLGQDAEAEGGPGWRAGGVSEAVSARSHSFTCLVPANGLTRSTRR